MTTLATQISIIPCDHSDPSHQKAVVSLINAYIKDNMGGGTPLSNDEQLRLVEGLGKHPTAVVFLAGTNDTYVGLLVAFENFSTFTARSMVNIHDVIVLPEYRGKGIGRLLLDSIIAEATRRKASRVTLEVRKDNFIAQNLYKALGFEETSPGMHYWRKYLE